MAAGGSEPVGAGEPAGTSGWSDIIPEIFCLGTSCLSSFFQNSKIRGAGLLRRMQTLVYLFSLSPGGCPEVHAAPGSPPLGGPGRAAMCPKPHSKHSEA